MAKTIKMLFFGMIVVSVAMSIFKMDFLEIAAFGVVVTTYLAFVFVWESIEKRIKKCRIKKDS